MYVSLNIVLAKHHLLPFVMTICITFKRRSKYELNLQAHAFFAGLASHEQQICRLFLDKYSHHDLLRWLELAIITLTSA